MLVQPKLEEEYTVLGKPVHRLDAYDKVTGQAVYAYDIEQPRMLEGKVLRSPYPHAKILDIDTSKAEALPGVRVVITSKDTGGALYGATVADTPVLAGEQVRYVGEPVAAVAADTRDIAEEALELIDVKYEELPALLDPEESLLPNQSTILHPDLAKYERSSWKAVPYDPSNPNICATFKIVKGDVEAAFEQCDIVIENKYTTQMVHHFYTEPNAVVAKFESDKTLTVWSSTQSAYRTRHELSGAMKMPATRIRVIVPPVGGGFGNKAAIYVEAITAHLAKKSGRPVRIQMTREEAMTATTVRHPFIVYCKHGAKKDGTIVAVKMKVILDGGAYSGGPGIFVTRQCPLGAVAVYNIPNVFVDSVRPYTNKVPGGAFRGFGDAQVSWAIECQMDLLAEKLGIDPAELRLKNFLNEGDKNAIGETAKGVANRRSLEAVLQSISRPKEESRPDDGVWKKGRGISVVAKYSLARTVSTAFVRLLEDTSLELWTSATEIGTGTHTVLAQIVAEEFRTSLDNVRVLNVDSQFTPMDEGAFSSRQTYNSGNAVKLACLDLKKEIFERAAKKLNASPNALTLDDGQIYVGDDKTRGMKLQDLFTSGKTRFGAFLEEGGALIGKATFYQDSGELNVETGQCTTDRFVAFYEYGAANVDLEVNTETGHVRIIEYTAATDVGKALNPKTVEGQLEGAIGMGLGATLSEELVLENGKPVNADLKDYKAPYGLDAPKLKTIILETAYKGGPFGAKGCGEAGIVGVAPAIANAIADAVGVRINDLPITPERVRKALEERSK